MSMIAVRKGNRRWRWPSSCVLSHGRGSRSGRPISGSPIRVLSSSASAQLKQAPYSFTCFDRKKTHMTWGTIMEYMTSVLMIHSWWTDLVTMARPAANRPHTKIDNFTIRMTLFSDAWKTNLNSTFLMIQQRVLLMWIIMSLLALLKWINKWHIFSLFSEGASDYGAITTPPQHLCEDDVLEDIPTQEGSSRQQHRVGWRHHSGSNRSQPNQRDVERDEMLKDNWQDHTRLSIFKRAGRTIGSLVPVWKNVESSVKTS